MDRLAKQQTCQLFVEQEIEKGLAEGKSHREIGRELSKEVQKTFLAVIDPHTISVRADRMAREKKAQSATNVAVGKPAKPRTKPDTKKRILEVAQEIKKGTVSDDDAKIVGDALADGIAEGTLQPRVGTKTATAVTKAFKKGAPPRKKKEPDTFYKLSRLALSFQEGLQFWADQTIKPETKDEVQYARVVRAASTSIITNYARLGIDVVGIYDTFYKGKGEGREKSRKALPEKL